MDVYPLEDGEDYIYHLEKIEFLGLERVQIRVTVIGMKDILTLSTLR